jgi:hypothetical protein
MTEEDLRYIERELSIVLPASYCKVMLDYPVPALRGNEDTDVWDNAIRLVEENKDLRQLFGWPNHLFALGYGAACEHYAIDLRHPDAPVWWINRWSPENIGSRTEADSFAAWSLKYFEGLRGGMEGDPNISPAEYDAFLNEQTRRESLQLIIFAVIALGLLGGFWLWALLL